MPDPDRGEPPVMEYAPPSRGRGGQLAGGSMLGIGAAAVLVVGSAFLGAYIDTQRNSGEHLAGLAGLMIGGMVGAGLAIVAGVAAIVAGRRRDNALLSGAGLGLLLSLGLGALGMGLCAVA